MTRSAFLMPLLVGQFAATLVTAGGLLAADAAPATTPQIPRKAPDLVIQIPGRPVHLSQYDGFIRVVAFMSTTCPHCQHLASVMSALQQEYAPKGVQMLGVVFNAEAIGDLANFAKAFAKDLYPVGLSTDAIVADFVQHPPGMHYIPMIAFIDKHGIIRAQHLGLTDSQFFDERAEVENIRGEIGKILKEPVVQLPAASKAAAKMPVGKTPEVKKK